MVSALSGLRENSGINLQFKSTQPQAPMLILQGPVEDGLVHVDIALPDYKLALFLENALEPQSKAANSTNSQSDGTTLNG